MSLFATFFTSASVAMEGATLEGSQGAVTNVIKTPTLQTLKEGAIPIGHSKVVTDPEVKASIQSERVPLVANVPIGELPMGLTPSSHARELKDFQFPVAAKARSSAPRRMSNRLGNPPRSSARKGPFRLDGDAKKQLLGINLALQEAKVKVRAAASEDRKRGEKSVSTSRLALKSTDPQSVSIRRHKEGYIRSVSGQFKLDASTRPVSAKVVSFLRANNEELNLEPDFTYSMEEICDGTYCIVKAVKYFRGGQVFGDDLSVITTGDLIRSINGRMANWSLPVQAKKSASKADLEQIARLHLDVLGRPLLADLDPAEGYRYVSGAYYPVVKLTVVTSLSDAWTVFIRSDTNEVIDKLPLVYDQSSVSSSGADLFGETQFFFSRPLNNGAYRLIDDSFPAAAGSKTTIGNFQNSLDTAFYVDAPSSSGPWDAAAVSALVNSRKSYDYFKNTFGRNGIDGSDGEMIAFVHYGSNRVEAFYRDVGSGQMVYGDGDGITSDSLAKGLDVAGHELAHGVVSRTAGLEYRFQSGALNESFADFFGAQIDRDDWLIGDDTWLAGPDCGGGKRCLRNMANPALSWDPQPSHMSEYENLPIDVDKGGVHINSGIPNRALYLLAEGLSNSVGRSVAEQIAYQTLLALTPTSDFQDAAETMYEIATVGSFPSDAPATVANAWSQVGIFVEDEATPPEVVPVGASSAQRSVIGYVFPEDDGSTLVPWLQSIDENQAAYDPSMDVEALPLYEEGSPHINPRGSRSRLSIAPENGEPEEGIYKGYFYAFVGDVEGEGSHLYLNYLFNYIDSATGELVWEKASSPPPPTVYADFVIQNLALSPNFAVDGTVVVTLQNSPYIYIVTPTDVFSYLVSGPDYTTDGSGGGFVENIDSLRWDPSSRKVVFDYFSCVTSPDGTCPSSWSLGVLDTVTGEINYPFPSQPSYIDLGYPAFGNISDRYIAMDLHRYDPDTGDYQDQFVIVLDTYEGELYDSGAIPNGCGLESPVWGAPSFTSDDASFIHQKCALSGDSYIIANYLTSRDELGNVVETPLSGRTSLLPLAVPGDEYHVDASLEFRRRDHINEAGGANYDLTTPLPHGSPGVVLSNEFCWKNTTSISSSILEAYQDDGIVSSFLPTVLQPGKAACSSLSIVPPKRLFENDPGYVYVAKSIRSNASLDGSIRYAVEAALPEAPELLLYDVGADYLTFTINNISSGGDKGAIFYLDCGDFSTTLDFTESGDLVQTKGVWNAHYDIGVTFRQDGIASGKIYSCEAKSGNRLGYSPTTTLTVSTLVTDSDGDGVPDDEDAFPNDPNETADSDGDGVGDNGDAFPSDANETLDTDGDGVGNNEDTDDDNDGYSDSEEIQAGTDPLSADSFPSEADENTSGLPIWLYYIATQPQEAVGPTP